MEQDVGSPAVEDATLIGKCLHKSWFHSAVKGSRAPTPCVIKEVIQHLVDRVRSRSDLEYLAKLCRVQVIQVPPNNSSSRASNHNLL
jgi:hypothetical protein